MCYITLCTRTGRVNHGASVIDSPLKPRELTYIYVVASTGAAIRIMYSIDIVDWPYTSVNLSHLMPNMFSTMLYCGIHCF